MAPSKATRSSAAQRKGSPKGSGKTGPPHSKQGKSPAQKRAATIAAKKAKDSEVEEEHEAAGEDSSEEEKESSEQDSGGDDGTEGSSSAGSDFSEDTKAELLKVIAARKAKKSKLSRTSTDVVTAVSAKVSVDKAAQKARRNDASVAEKKREKSRVTLGKIIAKIGTGTVAKAASLKISGLSKARKSTSSKKEKRKALSSPDQSSGDESDDLVELPAVPVGEMRIRKVVDKLVNWLALSALTHLPTPVPAFGPSPAHASLTLVYTAALLEMRGKINPRERPTYMTYLGLLEVVQRFLPQLLSHKPAALPVGNLYVCDIMAKIRGELDDAILTLDGQQELIDVTFTTFLVDLRAGGHAFQPVAAVVKAMASLSTSVTNKKTKTTINAAYTGAQGSSPALQQQPQHQQQQQGYHQQQLPLQHGGGQQTQQQWSDELGMLCREPELLDGRTLQWACVKCGAGASHGARGHNAADCKASDAEIEAWVHHGRAAP
jgi:hypothetical protein